MTVVIDHFGRINPAHGIDQQPFKILSELARRDNVWVKFSGADRITRSGPPYADIAPFAHRLAEIAPDRIVWGSDWPHVMTRWTIPMPNDGALADLLLDWIPDARQRDRVLADNPAALYGWT
jgi:predicted TIM-barrel fold metal-dependent hydrolase